MCLASQVAVAQHESQWRFGVALSAPTRLLKATSLTAPDSVFGHVDLGFGGGIEAGRSWNVQPMMTGAVVLRLTTAAVNAEAAGTSWSPGRAYAFEAIAQIDRAINDRASLFGGIALSHWSGPSHTAPFTGIAPVLVGADAGFSLRPGDGPWHIDLTANLTRFGASEKSGAATGFAWRWLIGVRHAR